MSRDQSIVLASASPRRRELLDQLGVDYEVRPVDIDESVLSGEPPETYVRRVTEQKALKAWEMDSARPVLAADTAVVLDNYILGKPVDKEHAMTMLSLLSGRTHKVYTAVSLIASQHRQVVNVTEVSFRMLHTQEQENYWLSGEPQDKAGAYAIQGLGGIFISRINGSYSGVMGLPLFETAELLSEAGIQLII